jgi:hypothetical protein
MLDKSNVEIFEGTYNNEIIAGSFKVIHPYKCFEMLNGPKSGKIEVLDENDERMSVWVNADDYEYLTLTPEEITKRQHTRTQMTTSALDSLITERFDTLERMAHGVISGHCKALVVSGSAGIGKTFTLSRVLQEADDAGKINCFETFSGSCGAAGLYQALYNFSSEGDVLMLDDMDKIFHDDEAINILKAALDTGGKRKVSWLKESRWLAENDIPDTFEFKGSCIFITNEDFHKRIQSNNKLAPHMEALVSRSSYLDLAIHSPRAIMIRVNQVVQNTNMLQKKGLDNSMIDELVEWLIFNQDNLMRLDLRTCLKIADFMKMDYSTWQQTARSVLLKPTFSY